jgi:photosystem II stability/assembly factor-like uncharacterized protein
VPTKLRFIWPVAAVLIVAGCSSSHGSKATITPSTTATTAPPTTAPVTAPGTTVAPATTTTASPGAALPAGFAAVDLSWVSDSEGWALGTAPCAHPPCTSIAHTLDGGRTWAGLPAPKASLFTVNSSAPVDCSPTAACVSGIRFASATVGYVFGPSSLWLTTDGGHTWSLRGTDSTDALEITRGRVVRITHPTVFGCPGCQFSAQVTTVGSTAWSPLSMPAVQGTMTALLAIDATNWYLAAPGHVAGGAQDAHTKFERSTDAGAHWSSFSDPCSVTASGNEADASAISAASGGYLAVACTARVAGEAGFVVVSADAGATFGPHRGGLLAAVPSGGEFVPNIAAATGQRLAVLVGAGGSDSVAVTNDGGADWNVTHSEAVSGNGPLSTYLGFQDATTGRAIVNSRSILTTTDGGGHWTPFTFP